MKLEEAILSNKRAEGAECAEISDSISPCEDRHKIVGLGGRPL
jgi:hypothetical protein